MPRLVECRHDRVGTLHSVAMEQERLTEILETALERNLSWIGAADTKAGFVFAIDTAMLGLLAAAAPAYGKWTPSSVTWGVIAAALVLASLGCLTAAVSPRTSGPRLSLIFFGAVADRDVDVFRAEVMGLDDAQYVEDLIQQVHVNASIAGQKYAWVKRATIFLYVGLLPWASATYTLFRDR